MEIERRTIPDAILIEIIARLPLRNIARFKSVCKCWKSIIELAYFRRRYISLHQNSSFSWSLIFRINCRHPITEALGSHGCETWDLPKSLASYIMPMNLTTTKCFYVSSSNGLIWIDVTWSTRSFKSFVGNPVLQQWVTIPPPPCLCFPTGLVTRVDEAGVVSSFKVINTCLKAQLMHHEMFAWTVYVFSSETGLWTSKRLLSSHPINYIGSYPPVNLNGMLYLLDKRGDSIVLIAHDFYGPEVDNQCQVIPLPGQNDKHVRRCLTTSEGDVIYIEVLDQRLKVWKLNNNSESGWWQLSWEINMVSVGYDVDFLPMAMNPFDSDIVYLWSRQHCFMVSGNLRTHKFIVYPESETWSSSAGCYRFNASNSKRIMEATRDASLCTLPQFVPSKWMDSIARPPN